MNVIESPPVSNDSIFAAYEERMRTHGWVIFERAVDSNLVERMLQGIEDAWKTCHDVQVKNGVALDADHTVHHLVGLDDVWIDLLDAMAPLTPFMEWYFQGKFVLNSLGGAINLKGHRSYAHRVHRDIRSFSGDMPLLLNTLVMLDDFTATNGATWLCTGSHVSGEKPSDEEFHNRSEQAIAPAGSILMFNSNLWHAGGDNVSDNPRRSVTPMFCKPFIKPQFDYPRAVGYERFGALSENARQLIGYYARIPASLSEWYQPPTNRMYRPNQG